MKITKTAAQVQEEADTQRRIKEDLKDRINYRYYRQYVMEENQAKTCPNCGSNITIRKSESDHFFIDRSLFVCPECHTEWETDQFSTYSISSFVSTDTFKKALAVFIIAIFGCVFSYYMAIVKGETSAYIPAAFFLIVLCIFPALLIADIPKYTRIKKIWKQYEENMPYDKNINYEELVESHLTEKPSIE